MYLLLSPALYRIVDIANKKEYSINTPISGASVIFEAPIPVSFFVLKNIMLGLNKNTLYFNNCLNLDNPDRLYYVNKTDINPTTGKAYAINPSSGVWDDNYWAQQVDPYVNAGQKAQQSVPDPIAQAQKYLDFQKTANQPVVDQLQKSSTDLQGKYADLIASIRGNGQVLSDKQTLTTNNELGKRGILPSSGLYQQEQVNAQMPITSSINSQIANTGMSQQKDITDLAMQIAQLQAGNVPTAITAGQNYSNAVQSANEFSQNLNMQQQQMQQQASQFDKNYQLQQSQASKLPTQIISIGGHDKLVNTQTGQVIQDLGATGTGAKTSSPALKSSDYLGALNSAITGKKTLSDIFNAFSPYLSPTQIVTQYNALSPYGAAKEPWAQALVKQPSQSESDASLLQSLINGNF